MDLLGFLVTFIFGVGVLFCVFSSCLVLLSYRFREQQNRLLYHPEMPADSTIVCESPVDRGFFNSENVHLRTADGVNLRGFIVWPSSSEQPHRISQQGDVKNAFISHNSGGNAGISSVSSATTVRDSLDSLPLYVIIYFHGNAGNVGHRIHIATLLTSKLPCAVLMVDYRGFGLSDPVAPTEEGLKLDAQACLEYVWNHPRIPQGRIFVMGTSLGGAVAIHLASQSMNTRRIAGVIVENTFTSVGDMVSVMARLVMRQLVTCGATFWLWVLDYYVKPLCLRIGWKNIDLVGKIRVPMLFIAGGRDEVVPSSQMKKLFLVASKSIFMRRCVEFSEGTHNGLSLLHGYTEAIDLFVQDVLRSDTELV